MRGTVVRSLRPQANPRGGQGAFTLIEVLVVVAILALLVAVLLPSLQRAREQAKVVADQANCKQIGNITGEYQTEHKGRVPVLFNYHHAKKP